MCGIAGFSDSHDQAPARLDRMVTALEHRGPDSSGSFHSGRFHLGMTRLAIIDIAGGAQPMHLEERQLHVVMNGEIYNHAALRATLEQLGHRFRTRSDTEVLLRGFAEWDVGVFSRLDGMFAVAIADLASDRLVLARDRFGEKPLYVLDRPEGPCFASEPKALRQLGPMPSLDHQAVAEYLHLGFIPAPRTIWAGVRKLLPAEVSVYSADGLRQHRFWELDGQRSDPGPSAVDGLRERLLRAVESRLVADVEVGVLLSGGIDSSLVAWAASQAHQGVRTFTVSFDDPARDEASVARRTSAWLRTQHTELRVDGSKAIEVVDQVPDIYDEPFADSSAIPTTLLSRAVAAHVKVALTGDGGDELFSGYPRYGSRAPRLGGVRQQLGGPLSGLAASRSGILSRIGIRAAKQGYDDASRYRESGSLLPTALVGRLLGTRVRMDELDARTARTFVELGHAGPRAADLSIYLPDDLLVKMDRASMSASLEARAPLLDPDLVTWALGLPAATIGPGGGKALPRALADEVLPPGLAALPKQGFSVPLTRWMRGPLAPSLREVLAPAELRRHGLLDVGTVELLLRRLAANRRGVAGPVWSLYVLQRWCERARG